MAGLHGGRRGQPWSAGAAKLERALLHEGGVGALRGRRQRIPIKGRLHSPRSRGVCKRPPPRGVCTRRYEEACAGIGSLASPPPQRRQTLRPLQAPDACTQLHRETGPRAPAWCPNGAPSARMVKAAAPPSPAQGPRSGPHTRATVVLRRSPCGRSGPRVWGGASASTKGACR